MTELSLDAASRPTATRSFRRMLPGLGCAMLVAAFATALAQHALRIGIVASPMVLALLLGLVAAQFATVPARLAPGIAFACRPLLRFSIVLLGLRLGFEGITALGFVGVIAIAIVVVGTLSGTHWLCRRLGLSSDFAWLLASGHAICGAAAVAAADAVLRAHERDAAMALALVTLLGTIAMLVCPVIAYLSGMDAAHYGFWVGGSVHEVAQAVAAGYAVGAEHGDAASVVKLARVFFLLPLSLQLTAVASRRRSKSDTARGPITVPWFVFGFACTALLRGVDVLPHAVVTVATDVASFAMTTAMVALGAKTSLRGLTKSGPRPLLAACGASLLVSLLALSAAFIVVR